MRLPFALFASLFSVLQLSRACHAAPQPASSSAATSPLYLEAINTAPLWRGGTRGEFVFRIGNYSYDAVARRCALRLRIRDDANKTVWTGRVPVSAARGVSSARFTLPVTLPQGPYEIGAVLDTSAVAIQPAKAAPAPFLPHKTNAFTVIVPVANKNPGILSALLADGRTRDVPSWLRESRLPLTALAPEGDDRFPDERARAAERRLRKDARIETVLVARENARPEANGDARFLAQDAARQSWERGQPPVLPLALDWPVDSTLAPTQRDAFATSAGALRGLVAARRIGSTADFAVLLPGEATQEPGRDGYDVLTRTATALAAGATRVLLPYDETVQFNRAAARRVAALAVWNGLTSGWQFERELFGSPLLRGVSFTRGRDHLALVWLERNALPKARLVARFDGEVFDAWGNSLPQRAGVCVLPLANGPVWVRSRARNWSAGWRSASLEGARLLAAQALPLRLDPRAGTKTLDVRVQNTGIAPMAGVLAVAPPRGWSLVEDEQTFRLAAGETRIFRFGVAVANANPKNEYPVNIAARRGGSRWSWQQTARVATASETITPPVIDGDVREWKDATWMRAGSAPVAASVALRWDATRLYIAAQVREPQVTYAETAEDFWQRDAVQFTFGLRADTSVRPQGPPFRDTDYGFVLLPWRDGEARLLRAWNPNLPFVGWNGRFRDRTRLGGAVPGVRVALRRDATHGITRYEASFPLNEIPTLRPMRRAAGDIAVRFGFQVHSREAPALSWSRANNVFAWWNNPVSFLGGNAPAAQVPLGFTALPPRELQMLPPAAPPRVVPAPVFSPAAPQIPPIAPEDQRAPETATPQPIRKRPRSTPRETSPPREIFVPPTLEPMSPSTLPPAAQPPGKPIAPSPAGE